MSHEHFNSESAFEVFFLIETESTCAWHSVGFDLWANALAFYQQIPFQKELLQGDYLFDAAFLERLYPLRLSRRG